MTDDAADKRGPSTDEPPTEPIAPQPSAWVPPTGGVTQDDPPPLGSQSPPLSFVRENLVRPRQGRYVAGVCGALARATGTDPVLWRVVLAVLGVLSGVGILLYLVGWLAIPADGDEVSPIESLLGRGRAGMTPVAVLTLGGAAGLCLLFIVSSGMRAGLLAAAVVLGVIMLTRRGGPSSVETPTAEPGTFGPGTFGPGTFGPSTHGPGTHGPSTHGVPTDGYRHPFAPHGPFAGPPAPPAPPPPPARSPQERPAKRERSRLGRLTFFAVVVTMGILVAVDLAGASVTVSAYFFAALVVTALGLVVGAWLGRARGLIALAILATIGLFVSTGVEAVGGPLIDRSYRPTTLQAVADRYDFTVGDTVLDLRAVDFTGQQQKVTVTMKLGRLRVLLPPTVDTTTGLRLQNGSAEILGRDYDGSDITESGLVDLGADGTGGGTLTLDLQMDTGNVEVAR